MNRRELVAAVAAHTDQDPKAVDQTLRGLVDVVSATIKKGDPVVMSGFTKWAKVKRAARTARNPQTGEPVKVKASQKVRITPLKALKDVAAGTAPAPKLTKATAKKAATTTTRRARATPTTAEGEAPVKRTRATKASAAVPARRSTRATSATAAAAPGTEAAPARKAATRKATTRKAAAGETAPRKATTRKAAGSAASTPAKRAPAKRTARS